VLRRVEINGRSRRVIAQFVSGASYHTERIAPIIQHAFINGFNQLVKLLAESSNQWRDSFRTSHLDLCSLDWNADDVDFSCIFRCLPSVMTLNHLPSFSPLGIGFEYSHLTIQAPKPSESSRNSMQPNPPKSSSVNSG